MATPRLVASWPQWRGAKKGFTRKKVPHTRSQLAVSVPVKPHFSHRSVLCPTTLSNRAIAPLSQNPMADRRQTNRKGDPSLGGGRAAITTLSNRSIVPLGQNPMSDRHQLICKGDPSLLRPGRNNGSVKPRHRPVKSNPMADLHQLIREGNLLSWLRPGHNGGKQEGGLLERKSRIHAPTLLSHYS